MGVVGLGLSVEGGWEDLRPEEEAGGVVSSSRCGG